PDNSRIDRAVVLATSLSSTTKIVTEAGEGKAGGIAEPTRQPGATDSLSMVCIFVFSCPVKHWPTLHVVCQLRFRVRDAHKTTLPRVPSHPEHSMANRRHPAYSSSQIPVAPYQK